VRQGLNQISFDVKEIFS